MYSSFYITLFDYLEFKRLNYYIQKIDFIKVRIDQYKESYKNVVYQKNIVKEQQALAENQFSRDSLLNKKGIISQEDLESSRSKYLQGRLYLENINSTLQYTEIQITQMQEGLLDTEHQYIDKKNTFETQLKTFMAQLLAEIKLWEQNYVFITPIDGRVIFTNYWTANQNLTVGESIFNIIPEESGLLMGRASMPMTRSGKVKLEQRVNIHFANFPDNEFGIVKGFVKNISVVPSQNAEDKNNYVVEIELPDGLMTTYKKELPYLPEMLGVAIKKVYDWSKGRYDSPHIAKELQMQGIAVFIPLVSRIMKKKNLRSVVVRKSKQTTNSDHKYALVKNELNQDFTTTAYNLVWVSDSTYIRAGQGWSFLTTVIDLFDRKVICLQ